MTFVSKDDFFFSSDFAYDFFLLSRGIGKVCHCIKGHPYLVSDVGDQSFTIKHGLCLQNFWSCLL